MERSFNRLADELRNIKVTTNFTHNANGSVLVEFGETKVICTVMIDSHVPGWLKGGSSGWLTAEYGMLPGCSKIRIGREKHLSSGRTKEIQRLIGRAMRAVVDLSQLPEKTVLIDCDVIQADGGTRTTSINGSMIALSLAMIDLKNKGIIDKSPIRDFVAAISVGLVGGDVCLDLDYKEDSAAGVDMNVAMLSSGKFIEIQGTAEHEAFGRQQLNNMLEFAEKGIREIIDIQKSFVKDDLAWLLEH